MRTVPCSEPYGEDGDYEEYYDEDMNYSAGDPASAGKGRSVCVYAYLRSVPLHLTTDGALEQV